MESTSDKKSFYIFLILILVLQYRLIMWQPLILVAGVIAVAVKEAIHRYENQRIYAFMARQPGSTSYPNVGNALELLGITRRTMFRILMRQLKKYKRRSAYWVFYTPYYFTSEIQVVQAVLGSTQHVTKSSDYDYLIPQGNGILSTNGWTWRKARKIINPAFRMSLLESHAEKFQYHTRVFHERLRQHAVAGDTFDLLYIVHTWNIDLVCDTLLDSRLDLLQRNQLHYAENMNLTTRLLVARFAIFQEWYEFVFTLLGKKKIVDEAVKPMWTLLQQILEKKWTERNAAKVSASDAQGGPKTLMQSLLDNLESGVLTWDEALDESSGMFLGGTITTAVTTSWIFKILAMRPDIQQKIYQEVIEICGGQEVTLDQLSKLVYLKMVIQETLRHFTVPMVLRRSDEDVVLDDGSIVPAGMNIILMTYELHHDPEYWERPGEFFPEHFSPEAESLRPKGAFVPFLSGPRACPGINHAMNAMRYIVANTILYFEFQTDEKMPPDFREENYTVVFALKSNSGYRVKAKERRTNDESVLI